MVGQTGIWRLLRGLVLVGAMTALGAMAVGVAGRGWHPVACAGGGEARVRVATTAGPYPVWFRLDPRIDASGTLVGQRLTTGIHGSTATRSLSLPPESFATGPFGGLVLTGADDGHVSRLSTIEVATGCISAVADGPDVIRRATVDRTGTTVYEVRVDRATRADLGVWRRPLDAHVPARRILAALRPDGRFGRTWSTTLAWSVDGDRLAIQTCGEIACRTRVFDPVSGHVELVDAPELGVLVGLTRDRIVTHAACRGLPCPLIATTTDATRTDAATRTVLAVDGGPAVLTRIGPDLRVVDTAWDGTDRRLRATSLDGLRRDDLGELASDDDLVTDAETSGIGDSAPNGSVLLAPVGRTEVPAAGPTRVHYLVVHPPATSDEGAAR